MAEIDPELLRRLTDPDERLRVLDPARHSDLALAESIDATRPRLGNVVPDTGEAPSLDRAAETSTLQPIGGEPKTLPVLSRGEQRRLPMISPGAPAGSAASYANQLQKLEEAKAHPWGSPENHPGTLGKIGHVLGKIGNIAGDVFAPATMSLIPGTELNRETQIRQIEPRLEAAKKGEAEETERAATTEETKARTKKLGTETEALETANKENLVTDAQGNVTGWKDNHGALHSLEEAGTPQAIKDIAETTSNKMQPKFEKTETGDIVSLKTDRNGKTTSEVVYKGTPKLDTDLVHGHLVNGKPHTIIVNKKSGELIKDLGEEAKSDAAAKEKGIEVVKAFDKDNKPHLLSKEDAEKEGYTHVTKASEKAINDASTHHVTLNDMQTKLNDVVASRHALDQNSGQRAIIAKALADKKNTTLGQLIDAGVLSGSTPETQEYIQSVLSLRESALGLPKEITGGSRVSEIQASALWGTLPSGASLNSDYALNQSKKFQANIKRLRERAPEVRGISITDPHPDLGEEAAGGAKVKSFKEWQEEQKKKKTP